MIFNLYIIFKLQSAGKIINNKVKVSCIIFINTLLTLLGDTHKKNHEFTYTYVKWKNRKFRNRKLFFEK